MKIVKLILAILLLLCLFKMPYGYYQLVRFLATMIFAFLAYIETRKAGKLEIYFWIFLGLAVLFQPFEKIALGRFIWNTVDILVAIFLIFDSNRKTPD